MPLLLTSNDICEYFQGKRASFKQWLRKWMVEMKISQLVILTSSHAHERIDIQLQGLVINLTLMLKMVTTKFPI